MGSNQALEAARALAQNPGLAPGMRNARLPDGVESLLRFLAGDDQRALSGRSDPARVQDMVERYIMAVMLYPGAAPERVLGVSSGASREQTRAHMRLLMIWLHPDRGADAWRSAYSVRVLEAWRVLSAPAPAASAARVSRSSGRRPQTMPLKLNWVPRPVGRPAPRGRKLAIIAPAVLILLIAAMAVFDNPLRQWAESTLGARASTELGPVWRSGL